MAEFDIADVRLDNGNYYSAGVLITAENSNADASSLVEASGNAKLYFPVSISSLESFTLTKTGSITDGVENAAEITYTIVSSGNLQVNQTHTYAMAENEDVQGDTWAVMDSLSITDGQWYYLNTNIQYLMDHVEGTSENSVSFDYEYETKKTDTKDSEKVSGSITLNVL